MEIPESMKKFELPQAVKNIELPAAMKNMELPAAVKNLELPAAVKNMELPAAVKNIELPEAVKNIDIQNVVRNVPNAVKSVPTAVMNNVPEAVRSIHVPKNLNANMFSSFATSAFTGVASLTKTIQQRVEQTTRELQHQHEEFVREIKEEVQEPKAGTEAVPPWAGLPNEDELKDHILALSQDKRNFTIPPPENTNFQFDMHAFSQTAMATLNLDPKLKRMRFELVPAIVSEPTFWRNYFYRVSLIKQTALGSIKDTVLEKEVYSEKSKQSESTLEANENQVETKEKKDESSNKDEVLFDSSKSGDDSDSWINGAAELEGLEDDDAEVPENWEEELKELSSL